LARIILVDDSASARTLLGGRLREQGHEVIETGEPVEAAELAIAQAPDAVVTDLWMPGISGLQLCRLLRSEPATTHVPVILLTASDDRRSRFWARHAGAAAYVTKAEGEKLAKLLGELTQAPLPAPSSQTVAMRGSVPERLSQLLDVALYESTIAGEIRALGQAAGDREKMFADLASLASDVCGYRWLALCAGTPQRLFVHTHPALRETAEREARDVFQLYPPLERRKGAEQAVLAVLDTRAIESDWSAAPLHESVRFGSTTIGSIALSPSRRGASVEDRRFMQVLGAELGGPMQMDTLVTEARRLANTDGLTGLLNRRAFTETIAQYRAKNAPQMFPMTMLLLDVDHFKKVNDTKGHDAGDAVLQGVARVLANMARKSDLVARWGGEEFVLALGNTQEPGGRIAAERLRRALESAKHDLPGGDQLGATASIGLASAIDPDWQLEDLLSRADKAMYSAKARGRNRVEVA
jgi:two-component system cell cycle response regulator